MSLDYAVPVLTIAALLLMRVRDRRCFLLFWAVNAIMIYAHARAGLWGLLAQDWVYVVFNFLCWRKWKELDSGPF